MGILWVDGELHPVDEARVSPVDHGFIVGDGIFESIGVWAGVPFATERHLDRLRSSAAGLGLPEPPSSVIRDACSAVLDANPIADGKLRITYTAGPGPLGSGRGSAPPTLVVAVAPLTPWEPTTAVVTVPWTRNERSAVAGLKTTSYAENVRALDAAAEHGASEAILANTRGELCEGTGTNIFVVVDGELLTPPLESGCLAGVTRGLLCELLSVREPALAYDVLRSCDEAFLTSATRNVQPIDRIDDRLLEPVPGAVTGGAADALRELMATTSEP